MSERVHCQGCEAVDAGVRGLMSCPGVERGGGGPILWLVVPDGHWSQRTGPYDSQAKAEDVAELMSRVSPCSVVPLYTGGPCPSPPAYELPVAKQREPVEDDLPY